MNLQQLRELIVSKLKLIALILSLITFLLLTQIALGQHSLKTTKSFVKPDTICLPKSLVDTMIHDLKERKILIVQNQALYSYKEILIKEIAEKEASIISLKDEKNKSEINLEVYKRKATLRGWQRNGLILGMIIFGIVVL